MIPTSTPQPTNPPPPVDRAVWTIDDAIRSSSTPAISLGVVTAAVALLSCLHSDVSWVTGLTLAALVPAALVDVMVRRLPNRLVAIGAGVWFCTFGSAALIDGRVWFDDAALGSLAMAGPLLVAHLLSPASMGFGDVKFAAVLGAAVGIVAPTLALVALTVGSLLAAIHGLAWRKRTIAFGPGLLAGATLTIGAVALGVIEPNDASAVLALAGRTL